MLSALISFSIRTRFVVASVVLVIAAFGVWQMTKLPVDAVPDITNKQVQINSIDRGLSPIEIEKRVTYPIENALAGIPGLETTRSLSRNGFSQVTAVFDDRTDLYFARQQVAERLNQISAKLPPGVQPQLGPITTGLGEVFMYAVDYKTPSANGSELLDGAAGWQRDGSYLTAEGDKLVDSTSISAYLRTVQDWIIAPQLRSVRGVAGIDTIGGFEKQYVVEPIMTKMASLGISMSELAKSLEAANISVGANYLDRGGEAILIRVDARIRGLDEIRGAVISSRNGIPITVRDVAEVKLGGELRTGAASLNGREVVIGTALMLIGENSRTVARNVGERLQQIEKSLPPGIEVITLLDRSTLVNATVETVQNNLIEGALLTAAVLFLLLGNARAAAIAVLIIPLSFLMMVLGMNALRVPGNLMSLGALDFGLIVDGAVIVIENSMRRLAQRQHHEGRLLTRDERMYETLKASQEMVKPTIYGQAIIFLVFIPLLTFTGVEGKTFSPMAVTIMLALASALILSLTFVPAMFALLITGKVHEKEVWIIRRTKTLYQPWLERVVEWPWVFIGGGATVALIAAGVFVGLGREFIPQLDEKNIALASTRIPSTGLDQSVVMQERVERSVGELPEVAFMFSKTGTAEVATDPMPPNVSDGFVILKPQSQWPSDVTTKADVIERINKATSSQLGQAYELSQPIQLRFNELIAGVRGDVAIKLYGDDLEKLSSVAKEIVTTLKSVPGAQDVKAEQIGGAPTLEIQFDRTAIGRYGLTVEEVADAIAAAMAGRDAGLVFEGDRRFPVVIRANQTIRTDIGLLKNMPIMLPAVDGQSRQSVPLSQLVQFKTSDGLNQVSRENGKRRVVIQANVRGRDMGSFVVDAMPKIAAVQLPTGSYIEWGGQYQNLQAASKRLSIIVPICFAAIFGLLYMGLAGIGRAITVFATVPLALAGGVFALALTGINFSVSAAVGFICLAGVTVLNGLVVMTGIRERLEAGIELSQAIFEGTLQRVRPIIMTGLVPAVGFVPMALATGTGAEVQKPLAMVVIGGLITATVALLFVFPALATVILGLGERFRKGTSRRWQLNAPFVKEK